MCVCGCVFPTTTDKEKKKAAAGSELKSLREKLAALEAENRTLRAKGDAEVRERRQWATEPPISRPFHFEGRGPSVAAEGAER